MDQEALSAAYGAERLLTNHDPRYNVAPTQDVPVLVDRDRVLQVEAFRWGLLPSWAKDPKIGYRTINARSETAHSKPSYRNAWKNGRRCLILANGFYEWQKPVGGQGPKVPHWIAMADGRPFGFAGLWETWSGDGEDVHTCTILTTNANELVRPIHDRMPVIIGGQAEWEAWIDPGVDSDEMRDLLEPYPEEEMHAYPVSTYVNRPGNQGPECIEPVAASTVDSAK